MTEQNTSEMPYLVVGKAWHQRLAGWLFRTHRWFGVISCIAVIMWGSSGVMHPIMSRLNPQPANAQPPLTVPALHAAMAPAEVLMRAGIKEVSGLRVLIWNEGTYYQVTVPAQPQRRYFEVNSGSELADGDMKYAEHLARHFVNNPQGKTTGVTRLEKFDDEYLSVNRLLPVYRIDFAADASKSPSANASKLRSDGLRVYVETSPPRLASLVDDTKATLGWLFRVIHQWEFLSDWDNMRMILITTLLSMALLSALTGLWMYGFMWQRNTLKNSHRPVRRWHRGIGIGVSLSTLLFTISGTWHLLGSEQRDVPTALVSRIPTEKIHLPESVRHGMWGEIALVQMDGQAYYQLTSASKNPTATGGEHDHSAKPAPKPNPQTTYASVDNGEIVADAASRHAVSLAGQYSGLSEQQITAVSTVTKFEGEYGFINKRLPVWRVDYATPDHLSYYVETSSGALATTVRDAARVEGWIFSYLHKFHWLDFSGKNVRDIVSALFALGNVIVASLGLWMFTRRYLRN